MKVKTSKYIKCGLSGVYFLMYKKEVVYIGATHDFPRRIIYHYDKVYDSIRFIECDNRTYYEKRLINLFRPKYNKSILDKELKRYLQANGHLLVHNGAFVNY